MTKPWCSDAKSRRSKKAQRLHAQLKAELARDKLPEPDKIERKRGRSQEFRTRGE